MPDTDTTTPTADIDNVDEGTTNPTAETTEDQFDPERAMATIKKLRSENRQLAREHRDALAKLTAIEDAQLSETERLQRQLADVAAERDRLATEARRSVVTAAIADAAAKAGAIRPDAIARLIDLDTVEIADGRPTNAADLVKHLQSEYPELFKTRPGTADAGAGRTSLSAMSWADTLRRQLTS